MLPSYKHRLLGALFLISVAVIVLPNILDDSPTLFLDQHHQSLPQKPKQPAQDQLPSKHELHALKSLPPLADEATEPQAWILDIGTYQASEAQSLVQKLQSEGFLAYIKEDRPPNKQQHVYVGPELKREDLQVVRAKLVQQYALQPKLRSFQPSDIQSSSRELL